MKYETKYHIKITFVYVSYIGHHRSNGACNRAGSFGSVPTIVTAPAIVHFWFEL